VHFSEYVDTVENTHTYSTMRADWLRAPLRLVQGEVQNSRQWPDRTQHNRNRYQPNATYFRLRGQIEPVGIIIASCEFNAQCNLPEQLHKQCYAASLYPAR
jgi:hypothetical protein